MIQDARALPMLVVEPRVSAARRLGPWGRTMVRIGAQLLFLASSVLGDDVVSRRLRGVLLRLMGADLGRGASVHGGIYITRPAHLVVGAGTFINRNCYLDLESRLVLGSRVTVGHGTTFVTTRHRLGSHEKRCGEYTGESIMVGDGTWIGANVTVLPGTTIGRGSVVAAGSVVRDDVPDDVLVAGVPARVRRRLPGPGRERGAD